MTKYKAITCDERSQEDILTDQKPKKMEIAGLDDAATWIWI